MPYRIAINGYGRIGQSVLRAIYESGYRDLLQVVALNELSDIDTVSYLTRYDTTHGRFPLPVTHDGQNLLINGDSIRVLSEEDPTQLPWQEMGIDLVLECSGTFSDRATAELHLQSGAGKLLFSQPAQPDVDATVVYGFNDSQLDAEQQVVAAGSCTTNCLVPVLDLLDRELGIVNGVTTTIHSAMNDQPVIDSYHQTDLRLTRSAMHSIIPVDTGLNKGIERLLPAMSNRFECLHLRVPTINVSVLDISLNVRTPTDAETVNSILRNAADNNLKGILGYTEEPHASVDFNRDPRSGIVDGTQTKVSGGSMIKLLCWFDNEWGFANRMLDVASAWLQRK
ncbi:MAG: glyceraldehyde 3-phosphate dehydrogenase NAD-binding domain-containing protein [Amphritea sp.]